jgi:hypothetical protein
MTVGTRIQVRNDTAANWTSANPTLLAGEPGFEDDTGKFKIGTGSAAWTALPYAGSGGASTPLTTTATKTANYTASANERVPVDTTSGAITVTLPTAPADGTAVEVGHIIQGSTSAVTIARGGSTDVFNKTGGSTSVTLSTVNQKMYFTYIAALSVWWVRDALSLGALDSRYIATGAAAVLTNTAPQTATTGSGAVGTSAEAMRADAVIPLPSGLGATQFWGSGADSSAVLDGTATVAWASKSGSVYTLTVGDVALTTLTISSGVTLYTNGNRLWGQTLTVNSGGIVSCAGNNASGATGGAASNTASQQLPYGGAGATGGTGAGAGGFCSNGNGQGGNAGPGFSQTGSAGASGAGGASGGTAGGAAAGNNGQSTHWYFVPMAAFNGFPVTRLGLSSPSTGAGGGAGAGDGTNAGGGGGGGGGAVLLNFKTVVNNGTITANGGNGAAGVAGNAGGGGAGQGGWIIINTSSYTGSGTRTAVNGTPGAASGTGTIGGAGTTPTVTVVTNVW